jgi:ABC-type sugar transport system substrate-binding protein
MKKAISIILAVLMVFTLFACSNTKSPSPAPSAPSETPSAQPSENSDVAANANSIGFFSDGVDPASRKTYNIVFAYPRPMQLMQNVTDALERFQNKLNFKLSTMTGDNDMDVYIQNLEVLANQGIDGFICVIDPNTADRIKEVLDELGVPYIGLLNTVRDSSGSSIVPCVALDGYAAGQTEVQWLYDNYKKYWGEIDPSQIGLLDITFSANKDFQDRYNGAMDKFKELFPNNTKIFSADGVTGKMDADTGYNLSSAVFSGNPDVKYWFVVSCLEMYAQGAARAAEGADIDDTTLISCVGSDILSAEWDKGYEGAWVTCLAVSDLMYATPTICGIIALLDGKATPENLWQSKKAAGDKSAIYYIGNAMVTKETYKDYFAQIEETLGLEK